MAMLMVFTMIPLTAMAAENPTLPSGTVTAKKTASGPDADGNYTITLTVQGKDVEASDLKNIDVVLVVDNSGSMGSDVKCGCSTDLFIKHEYISWEWWVIIFYPVRKTEYICPDCGERYDKIPSGGVCTGYKSRLSAAKSVAKAFAEKMLESNTGDDTDNRVSVIGFSHNKESGGANDTGAIKVFQNLTNVLNDITSALNKMKAEGGTNYSAALQKAYETLNARTDAEKRTRKAYVIFISDGAPGYSGNSIKDSNWNGWNQAEAIKKAGIELYTIGIQLGEKESEYLKSLASAPQSQHYKNVVGDNYKKQLEDILTKWANQIQGSHAGTNAVLTDIVNTDVFDIVSASGATVGTDGKTVVWNIGDITETTQTLNIVIKPKPGKFGEVNTNKDVNLKYTDYTGEDKVIGKEKIGDPKVTLPGPIIDGVSVMLHCETSSNHSSAGSHTFNLIQGSYTVSENPDGTTLTLTVNAAKYVEEYNKTVTFKPSSGTSGHTVLSTTKYPDPQTMVLVLNDGKWVPKGNKSIVFHIKCGNYQITDISKTVVLSASDLPEDVVSTLSSYTITYPTLKNGVPHVATIETGKSYTFVFKIVVSGDPGAEVTITDDKATFLTPATGTVGEDGTFTAYVVRSYTSGDAVYENEAYSFANFASAGGNNDKEEVIIDKIIETKKIIVTIKENGGEYFYKGSDITVSGYEIISISDNRYTKDDFEFIGTDADKTVSGKNAGTYGMNLKPEHFRNKNDKFSNVEFVIVDNSLIIKPLAVTIISADASKTYDGKPLVKHDAKVSGFIDGEGVDITFTGTITDVGRVDNSFTYKAKDGTVLGNYSIKETKGKLEITKCDVVLESDTLSKKYDRQPLVNGSTPLKTETGWAEGEGATYNFTGTITAPGSIDNAFDVVLKAGTKETNYNIIKSYGKLIVTAETEKVTVTITENSGKYTYDGSEKTVKDYTVVSSNPLYIESDFEFTGSAVVKATDAGKYPMQLKPSDFTNKNTAFTNVEFVIKDGELVIEARTLILESATLTKTYDTYPLVNGDTPLVTETGWVEGEGATYRFTGSQVEIGERANSFEVIANSNTKLSNYNIQKKEGKLKVTEEKIVTVEIPFVKEVVRGGSSKPGSMKFDFLVYGFVNSDIASYATVTESRIATNGTGKFNGVIKISVPESKLPALAEGFFIREKNPGTKNWKYSNSVFFVKAEKSDNGEYEFKTYSSVNTDTSVSARFVNTYTYSPVIPPIIIHFKLQITKVDEANPDILLGGAVFDLYFKGNDKDVKIGRYVTAVNGVATATVYSAGEYYWVEVTPPTGYNLDTTNHYANTWNKTAITVTNKKTETPPELNSGDHVAFVIGYDDGLIHPEANITRAEAVTIFFRLLNDDIRNANMTKVNSFSDVNEGQWFNTAISTMAKLGIVFGRSDGTFGPNEYITRGEFAAMAARFDGNSNYEKADFSDITGHWAADEISKAAANGWLKGYTDGSFKPDQAITRAEAMALVNRVLGRNPESEADLHADMIRWADNMDTSSWYYLDVQEATNSHNYNRRTNGKEYWTEITEAPDWANIEK